MGIPVAVSDPSTTRFNPIDHPLALSIPEYLSQVGSWHGHIPFAFYLIPAFRPNRFVELGVHRGDSYCAFAQAIAMSGSKTVAFGIDTFTGDEHSGLYGPEIFEELSAYHNPLYSHFSTLIKTTFDKAVTYFSPGSIDLLHIDGLHTYEAVKHDFETWLPYLSDRAIVLFHDTCSNNAAFGVSQFFRELQSHYPTFSFIHCYGLGILWVNKIDPSTASLLNPDDATKVQLYFAALGAHISFISRVQRGESIA